MTSRPFILSLLLLFSGAARAVAPLPEASRIPTTVEATLTTSNPTMHMPTDVAVDSKGTIYVADGARDRIAVFSKDRQFQTATTRPAGQSLKRPVGISIDAQDNLWIADSGHQRVLGITPDDKLIDKIDLPAVDEKRIASPTSVLVTPDNKRIYIVDNPNHRLFIRDNATKTISVQGKLGQAAGQFNYPFMLGRANNGDILITEAIGSRVQVLGANDKWAGAIGSWGVELGQLFRPKGVVVDKAGRIFISDSTLYVIQAFDARGRVIGCLTTPDGRPMKFEHPMGMAFDNQGRLYVVELNAHRVAILTLEAPKP